MSKTTKMIVAIVALIFMTAFTVLTILSMYDSALLGGAALYLGLACGVVGVGLYLLLMRDNRLKNDAETMRAIEIEKAKQSNAAKQSESEQAKQNEDNTSTQSK